MTHEEEAIREFGSPERVAALFGRTLTGGWMEEVNLRRMDTRMSDSGIPGIRWQSVMSCRR